MTIEEATLRYGHVYQVTIDNTVYTYRPLTVGEYRKFFTKTNDDATFDEKVVRACTLEPTIDFGAAPGKLPTVLSKCIQESSLLGSDADMDAYVNTRVELYKKVRDAGGNVKISDNLGAIMIAITQAFPSTDPIMLDKLTTEELLDLYAMSLFKLGGLTETETAPTNMPLGLSRAEQQQFKEQAAAAHSESNLKKQWEEDKRKARGR
jgi:hypothetical protein